MTPTDVIDLRHTISCAECGEPLALWLFNGDPSTLVCSDCAAVRDQPAGASSSVSGPASFRSFAGIG